MLIRVHAVSHRGYVRRRNEDMVLCGRDFLRDGNFTRDYRMDGETGGNLFFAVADGLGGAPRGDAASEASLRFFADAVNELPVNASGDTLKAFFENLTKDAHASLNRIGEKDLASRGMGTTLTGLLFHGSGCFWVHIGDTRLYEVRDGVLIPVTRDHTLREMSGNPDIPPNILTNCLGGGMEAFCDTGFLPLREGKGRGFLLTSDGLHDYIEGNKMREIVHGFPEDPADALLEAALAAGGVDNISCLWVQFFSA